MEPLSPQCLHCHGDLVCVETEAPAIPASTVEYLATCLRCGTLVLLRYALETVMRAATP